MDSVTPASPCEREVIRVSVVDNHDFIRDGVVASLVSRAGRFAVLGAYADVAALLAAPAPDVVVLDLYLKRDDTSSTPLIPAIAATGAKVVLHTAEERPIPLRQALAAGASGISLKNDGREALIHVIEEVAAGEFVCSSVLARALVTDDVLAPRLTPREVEVLEGLSDGLTKSQVARRLGIGEETVRTYLKAVRIKYVDLGRDVTNAASIVREASRDGWID